MADILSKKASFDQRWKLTPSADPDNEFLKFKRRILNISMLFAPLNVLIPAQFAKIHGLKPEQRIGTDDDGDPVYIDVTIKEELEREQDVHQFYYLVETLFDLPFGPVIEDMLYEEVREAIELSNIDLAISKKGKDVILHPRGEKTLDHELIDRPLGFLRGSAEGHFKEALRLQQKGSPKDLVQSADQLRRAVEEYLRLKLRNSAGLKENLKSLERILKEGKADSLIRNLVHQTLGLLDTYFNENTKHNDGDIDRPEIEFLVYQTGCLLRYISQVIPD